MPEIDYCIVTNDEWQRAVDAAIDATPFSDLPWTLAMECPRCHHEMTTTVEICYGVRPVDLDDIPTIPIACNCHGAHPQAKDAAQCGTKADDAEGCGVHGEFVSPWKRQS